MTIDTEINAQAPLLHALLNAAQTSTEAMRVTVAGLQASPQIDGKAERALPKVIQELKAIDDGFSRLKEAMYQAGFGQGDTTRGGSGGGG